MVLGVSTRRYARSLEPLGESVGVAGASNSAVSERFVAGSGHKLAELMGRELSGFKPAVLMIDGVHFAEHGVDRGQWTIRLRKPSRARKGSAGAHLPSSTLSLTMRTYQRPIPRHETRSLASCGSSGWGSKSESYDPTTTEVALLSVSPMLYATRDDPTLLATEDAANL
jgi:hypothetical protein